MTSRYAALSREQLATLVPELLLIGQLIDRSGMALVHQTVRAREEMLQIAIEEWMGASPIYTKRMQKALKYEGVDVITIFKGLQLDIGAPPQFMDFRYTVHDRWHGEFHLDHCGALLDVEPMGEDYVRGMCHDIEDPTFDATAVATNRRAQVRPDPPAAADAGRPAPALRVDGDHRRVLPGGRRPPGDGRHRAEPAAARTELDPIDADDEGQSDYSGELMSDVDFGAFSHSALVRIADEVCLQMHLLNLSFVHRGRQARQAPTPSSPTTICTKQLIGIAGVAAERIHSRARSARRRRGRDAQYSNCIRCSTRPPTSTADFGPDVVHVRRSAAHEDGAWVSLVPPGVDTAAAGDRQPPWTRISTSRSPAPRRTGRRGSSKPTRRQRNSAKWRWSSVSGGSAWVFEPRKSLPLTVV